MKQIRDLNFSGGGDRQLTTDSGASPKIANLHLCRCCAGRDFFSSSAKIFGSSSTNHSPSAHFVLRRRSVPVHQLHSLGQGQSTVTQLAEKSVDERFLTTYMRAGFPDGNA